MRRRAARLVLYTALLVGVACASSSPPPRGPVHQLRAGENVYRLSQYYGVPVRTIVRANRIGDVADVPVGARLVIPGARRPPPKQSLALASIGPPGIGDYRDEAREHAEVRFRWPLEGRLSSGFGRRRGRPHEGIDIAAKSGTPIRAAAAGRVIHSGWLGGYGRVVIVKHAGDFSTVYAHNRQNKVRKGDFVEQGQVIALVGATGRASGPHVHFEVRRNRRPQDPLRYLP